MGTRNYGELAKSATTFKQLPVGTYNVEVTGAEVRTSSNGNVYYRLELTVEDGPHKGEKAWSNVTLTEENPGTFFGQLRTLGLGPDFFAQFGEVDDEDEDAEENVHATTAAALIGKRAIAPVKQGKEYQGQPRTEVGFFKPAKGAAPSSGVPSAPAAKTPGKAKGAAKKAAPGLPPGLEG